MAVMEILTQNILNTTTMVKVDSNTTTVERAFDRNLSTRYQTSDYNSDTSTIFSVEFSATPISNIMLLNHNLKDFRLFYNSVTANSLHVTTTNSDTSTYLSFSSVTVSSVQLQMNSSIQSGAEKRIGEFVICERTLSFPQNPTIKLYKPLIDRTQIKHKMPDGGIVLFNVKDKYRAKIGLRYITTSFYDSLLSIYEAGQPFYFVPFPTQSSDWDGKAHEVVWSGDFDFNFSSNVKDTYSGNMMLEETISG